MIKKTVLSKLIGGVMMMLGIWIFLTGLLVLLAQKFLAGYMQFINEIGVLPSFDFIFNLDPVIYVFIGLALLIWGWSLKKNWTPAYIALWVSMALIALYSFVETYITNEKELFTQMVVAIALVIYLWWAYSDANEEYCAWDRDGTPPTLGKKIACMWDVKK